MRFLKILRKLDDDVEMALEGKIGTWPFNYAGSKYRQESNLQKLINGERNLGRKIDEQIIDKALSQLTKRE